MIDPRIKGFLKRLGPSLLAAAGASFCLFALMSFMIAGDDITQLVPEAKLIKVENVRPPEDTIFIRADVVETLPKSFFTKALDKPADNKFLLPKNAEFETVVPFEKVTPMTAFSKIDIAMVPVIDRDAILLAASDPRYPPKAEREGVEGHIVVAMNVGSEGKVNDAWIVEASPEGYFEDQALRAAKRFKYRPRVENGKKVIAANLQYRWDFNLPDES